VLPTILVSIDAMTLKRSDLKEQIHAGISGRLDVNFND
jgi:hypothetical protein